MAIPPSNYLRYLPAALSGEAPTLASQTERGTPTALSLDQFLRIFETVLSGRPEVDWTEKQPPPELLIEQLHTFFDLDNLPQHFPRRKEWIEWLADWVGLGLPTSKELAWDEHQLRRAVARAVSLQQERGLLSGLHKLLELYVPASQRPRVAVDDGAVLYACTPRLGEPAPIYTMLGRCSASGEPITQPTCIVVVSETELIIGDLGTPTGAGDPKAKPGVHRLLWDCTTGFTAQRLSSGLLSQPIGLALDSHKNLFVLDSDGTTSNLYWLPAGQVAMTPEKIPLNLSEKGLVAVLACSESQVLLLGTQPSCLYTVSVTRSESAGVGSWTSKTESSTPLKETLSPLCMTFWNDKKSLIIAYERSGKSDSPPAKVTVYPFPITNVADKTEVALGAVATPVAICPNRAANQLYVLDLGLSPRPDNLPRNFPIAQAARIYSVDLQSQQVTSVTQPAYMHNPRAMAVFGDKIVLCERGGYSTLSTGQNYAWRVFAHEFAVILHFGGLQPPGDAEKGRQRQIRSLIEFLIEREKPAHTRYSIVQLPAI